MSLNKKMNLSVHQAHKDVGLIEKKHNRSIVCLVTKILNIKKVLILPCIKNTLPVFHGFQFH